MSQSKRGEGAISAAEGGGRTRRKRPLNEAQAVNVLREVCSITNPVLVGSGNEGFVFGKGGHAYKVFAEGRAGFFEGQLTFLREVMLRGVAGSSRILPLLEIIEAGDEVVFMTPLISGTRYSGGGWDDLVRLIRECHDRGIALTNIRPENLLRTPSGVIYIDLGRSIERLTGSRLSQMCKRAFLTFKFPTRPDLFDLLHRTLSDPAITELEGVEVFEMDVGTLGGASEPHLAPQPSRQIRDVTLLIRTCAMEWRTIEFQVRHIVSQLESPHRFRDRVIVWDANEGPFERQYDDANVDALRQALEKLVAAGTVDRLVEAPLGPGVVKATAMHWFGLETTRTKSRRGEPTHASLYGFDHCRTDLVLHVDSDILIGRTDPGHDYLSPMIDVLTRDSNGVTVSLPPQLAATQDYTCGSGGSKWRVETRCSLISRERVERLLPLPNRIVDGGRLELSWYRALDARLAQTNGQSYRGGTSATYFIHVPNSRKRGRNDWFNVACALQRGMVCPSQLGEVNLVGAQEDWLGKRREDLVFVVRGRDVPLPKLRRCVSSLLIQEDQDFGVIFLDGGSSNGMAEYLEYIVRRELPGRVTLYRNWDPLTSLENQTTCLHSLVARADSVVALLDADDALLGRHVVDRIKAAYRGGADLTVGSMLRTDRHVDYTVSFEDPRHNRKANVWQHISTFRRALFDRIRDDDLKIDGDWVPYAEDWAVMVPMVELASNPVWIREKLYLYDPDPSHRFFSREDRERMIAKICQKPSYFVERSLAQTS